MTQPVFLAFDEVWLNGIIYKLKCNGISGNLLNFKEEESEKVFLDDLMKRINCSIISLLQFGMYTLLPYIRIWLR